MENRAGLCEKGGVGVAAHGTLVDVDAIGVKGVARGDGAALKLRVLSSVFRSRVKYSHLQGIYGQGNFVKFLSKTCM